VSLELKRSDYFWTDLCNQVDWYRDRGSPQAAQRFVDAVEATLDQLREMPELGRVRFADWPELAGMYSRRVQRPFQRLLIFYRFDGHRLFAERLIHGRRDLPRRLLEPPASERTGS